MRPTQLGRRFLVLTAVTLAAALASGNNLLYLLYALMAGIFAVSAAVLAAGLRGIEAEARAPEGAFARAPFQLRLRVGNRGRWGVWGLRARLGSSRAEIGALAPGSEAEAELVAELPWRGRNAIEGLRLESDYPLGLLKRSLPVAAAALALPPGRLGVRARDEAAARSRPEGSRGLWAGGNEDLRGVRPYNPSDEQRRINWKQTARMGFPYVNEFVEPKGGRITVCAEGDGPDAERGIEVAAAACRRAIEAGCEVRLLSSEGGVEYGRGPGHLRKLQRALALLGQGKTPRPAPAPEGGAKPGPGPSRERALAASAGLVSAAASLLLVEDANSALLAALVAAIAAGAAIDFRRGRRPLPRWAWTAASALVLCYSLLLGWRALGVTLANTYLIAYLLAHQALNEKTERALGESLQICFLGFFLASGQTINPWYFVHFLVFSVLFVRWLACGPAGGPPRAAALARLVVACLLVCAASFAMTPRIDPLRHMNPFVAMGLDKRAPKAEFIAGFTENVTLGFFGNLKKSSARVMRVRLPGWDAAAPPYKLLRLRGSAFDAFDGRSWRKDRVDFGYAVRGGLYGAKQDRAWVPRDGNRFLFPGARPEGGLILEFTVLPMNSSVIFTTRGIRALETADTAVYFDHTDTVYAGAPYLGGITYLAASDPASELTGLADQGPGYERLLSTRFLQLPADLDPRARALAEKVARDAGTPAEKARAIERFLRKAYAYSLYAEGPNRSLNDFLFRTRSGNCEHFATAAAILLRTLGVPARLVSGFLADDWNEYGRFYDVRQGQAHAWAEAYVPGRGWMTVEATPPGGEGEVRSRLRRYLTALQASWYRNIIGYDRFMQKNTFHRFQLSLRLEALVGMTLAGARSWAWLLAALAALGAGAWLLAAAATGRGRRARTHFDRAAALLARRGLSQGREQTPREFAGKVASERPELGAIFDLAELHYAARYRPSPLEPRELRRADEALEELRANLRAGRVVQ